MRKFLDTATSKLLIEKRRNLQYSGLVGREISYLLLRNIFTGDIKWQWASKWKGNGSIYLLGTVQMSTLFAFGVIMGGHQGNIKEIED